MDRKSIRKDAYDYYKRNFGWVILFTLISTGLSGSQNNFSNGNNIMFTITLLLSVIINTMFSLEAYDSYKEGRRFEVNYHHLRVCLEVVASKGLEPI